MESEDTKTNVESKKNPYVIAYLTLLSVSILTIVFFVIHTSNQNTELQEKDKKYNEVSQKISETNIFLDKVLIRADSMNKILTKIHGYMPMVTILQYRDSVCSQLPYKSGDVVLMKPDSSKWVIVSTIIKGGKWQHTINYILRDCTGKQIEVEPETLY